MNLDTTDTEFNLTENVCDIESRFYRFYSTVIKDYFDLDEDFIWMTEETSYRARQTQKQKNKKWEPDKLLRLCIQDTCLGLRKFYESLVNYIEIAKYLAKKNLITIYCAAGESLFTALGICIVIDEAVKQYGASHERYTTQIELFVTEKEMNWKSICYYIVERVTSCYKNVDIKLELIDESSTRLSPEVFRTVKEIDIVVMARFLSRFHYLTIRTHFLEVILKQMKELSILFYLDECREIYDKTLKSLILKTDSLLELSSGKTIFELFEDLENEKYRSEFQFLYTFVFEEVMYSTYVKCHGIKDNNSFENVINISKRFKKENSLPSPEVKYLTMSSKYSSNVASGKPGQIMAQGRENTKKPSKKVHNANSSPSTSQDTTFHYKNNKPLKKPKD